MCGILTIFSKKRGFDLNLDFISFFLDKRGPDGLSAFSYNLSSGLSKDLFMDSRKNCLNLKTNEVNFFHSLYSFDGFKPMPFEDDDGYFLSNHEIFDYPKKYENDSVFLFDYAKNLVDKLKDSFDSDNFAFDDLKYPVGMYAFEYFDKNSNKFFLKTDPFSIKSLYYYLNDEIFILSSEKKMIFDVAHKFYNEKQAKSLPDNEKKLIDLIDFEKKIEKVNPHEIVLIDIGDMSAKKLSIGSFKRNLLGKSSLLETYDDFSLEDIYEENKELVKKGSKLFLKSLFEVISQKKKKDDVAVLFSGGIDSSIIAFLLKKYRKNFGFDKENDFKIKLFGSVLKNEDLKEPKDLFFQKKFSNDYNLDLDIEKIDLDELESDLPQIIRAIESIDPIKVSVAIPFFYSLRKAKKQGFRLAISGLGSEEIFAGYNRHYQVYESFLDTMKNGNLKHDIFDPIRDECIYGLNNLSKRDLYRDDLISMYNSVEVRFPFLNQNLVSFSLDLPFNLKLNKNYKKIFLRLIAYDLGLSKTFYDRKKLAAQYGSNFDKALLKLAKKNGFKKRKDYLRDLAQNLDYDF